MQNSKLPAQDKKSKLDDAIAAQIKLEQKRLQLEIQIRKKNEEEKQKALLKKQQKEALPSQRKDTKIENPSRSDVSRLSKDSEVKDSLSHEKIDEIQNNLQSLIKSKTFEPFSSEDEPTQALERNVESSEKQDSGRSDNAEGVRIENYAPIGQNDRREGRSNENKPSLEKGQQDDIRKRFENLEPKYERATTENIYARNVKEEYSPKKLELKVGSPSLERSSDRDGLIRNTAEYSTPDNFVVPKNNSYENQIKIQTNVTLSKEDRDPLGGAVKMQLELANQMKKFKLDEEKRKKNKEEAGLQRKHEILRQIKGTGMGQQNLMKPESGQSNSLSSAEKNRSIKGSKNLDASHEEDVRREDKFSGLKATPEVAENDRANHLRMSQRKSVHSDKEASEEDVQYGESSEFEDPIEKENAYEQSRGDELLNDSQQYNKIAKSFSSQRNDLDPRVSQQRSSGGYKETLNREYLTSKDRDEDIQEHQPQSYAQLHARKNLNPERKAFNPDTEEGLSKLLRSYEKGDPEEEERGYYRMSHEDSKRQDDVELNYSQSERELEDTNQNPLLTFGKKDFNRKDEGINPLDMSNSFRNSIQDPEQIPKAQSRSVIENKDDNFRNDNSQRNNDNWGYNPKTNVGIKQKSDIKHEPFEEREEDEEDYEHNHEISQNEEEEEERSNETGGFANNVEREQNLSEGEDDADQKPYYIVDQHQMGSLSGSGQKKKELIRYGDEQMGTDDDFTSETFGYKGQDKPSRVRKGWGDTKNDENSAKNPTSVNSFAPIEDEGNEYDEEEYDTENRFGEEAEVIHKEDQKHEDDKKSENKLITFDDSEDETARQRKMKKFENFMQRRQESQERMKEKKEKEKAKRAQNQPRGEEITFGNVSEEGTPQNSKRPISRERHSQNTKQDQVPIYSNKMRPPSANVRNPDKPIKKDPNEEFKSVEASAKSNKSEMKSPSPNIFVPPRPSISGKKEFSKPTNKQNIKNAITNVCLAGEPNRKEREEVLSKIDAFKGEANFIIGFNAISARLVFKAVYAYDSLTGEIKKIYSNGTAPEIIDSSVAVNYYNYNNGPKEFKPIQGNKSFSLRVDAVSLQPQLFRKPTSQNLF